MINKYDVVVIGAGVIGAAVSDELAKNGYKVAILEKNAVVAGETSEGNSGVVHSGLDPTPGKLNATLNIEGRKLYENKWFKELDFPWKKANTLIIAFNKTEEKELDKLYDKGLINGIDQEKLKIISTSETLYLEPNINPTITKALLCSSSYIVDPVKLTSSLVDRAISNNAKLFLEHKVVSIKKMSEKFIISCQNLNNNIEFLAKYIINCAGHYSDEIANMINAQNFQLRARRGQYCILEKDASKILNSHVIFLVPSVYGKGVIVAPMPDGHVLVGPTAEENIDKIDTRIINMNQVSLIQKLGNKIMPKLNMNRITKIISGSRTIANTDDFIIEYAINNKNFINITGIKSPGLTAAPAIALRVAAMIKNNEESEKK